MVEQVSARLSELQATLNAGFVHRQNVLTNIGYNLDYWVSMVSFIFPLENVLYPRHI